MYNVYADNGLYYKAKQQLDQGAKMLKKQGETDPTAAISRARLYNSYSDYYALLKNPKKSLEYFKLLMEEHEKKKDDIYYREMLCLDYSNIAIAYLEIDTDSSEYYALKSIAINKTGKMKNFYFSNFLILGQIYQKKLQYEEALQYYHRAEQIMDSNNYYNNYENISILYNDMIDIYTKKKDTANINKYSAKLGNFNLKIAENKNNSLSKVIDNMETIDQKRNFYFTIITTMLLVSSIIIVVIILHRKNSSIIKQEKISQQYLEKEMLNQNKQSYSALIEMVKTNDPAFFSAFQEIFPDFFKKLSDINPNLVLSEIEFCALLKLNLSTKDIARYRFIEPRTVQNKKYRIRKRLNIPNDMDIYHWFGTV